MREQRVLIAGCGDIGTRLGIKLSTQGAQVFGLRRTINQLPTGIHGIAADLADLASLKSLPQCDWVFYTAAAGRPDPETCQRVYVEGLRNLLTALPAPPRHLFLTGSSRVYAQSGHEWVDEQSAAEPEDERGRILLASEQLALQSGLPATVVRFSGIYGPGRDRLLQQVLAGTGAPGAPLHYSNRIHSDDCAGVLEHLLRLAAEGQALQPVYLASDDAPTPIHEVMEWLAERMGVTIRRRQPIRRSGSKRCSNRLLRASGYRFIYPDFRRGYTELLQQR